MRRFLTHAILLAAFLAILAPALAVAEAQTQPAAGKLTVTYYFLPC